MLRIHPHCCCSGCGAAAVTAASAAAACAGVAASAVRGGTPAAARCGACHALLLAAQRARRHGRQQRANLCCGGCAHRGGGVVAERHGSRPQALLHGVWPRCCCHAAQLRCQVAPQPPAAAALASRATQLRQRLQAWASRGVCVGGGGGGVSAGSRRLGNRLLSGRAMLRLTVPRRLAPQPTLSSSSWPLGGRHSSRSAITCTSCPPTQPRCACSSPASAGTTSCCVSAAPSAAVSAGRQHTTSPSTCGSRDACSACHASLRHGMHTRGRACA
jgi:hypothetical protein